MSSNTFQWNPSMGRRRRAGSLNIKYHDKMYVPIQKNNMRLRFKIICMIYKSLYRLYKYMYEIFISIAYKITLYGNIIYILQDVSIAVYLISKTYILYFILHVNQYIRVHII